MKECNTIEEVEEEFRKAKEEWAWTSFDNDKPIMQIDWIGFKVIFPDGTVKHELSMEEAALALSPSFRE